MDRSQGSGHPLFESFSLGTHRETFDYSVREDGIFVTRNPGPTKTLDPTPRRLEDLRGLIIAANDWAAPHSFLHRLAYAGYVDGVYTSVRDGALSRYLPTGAEQTQLGAEEVPAVLADLFGVDPALYFAAVEVQQRHRPAQT